MQHESTKLSKMTTDGYVIMPRQTVYAQVDARAIAFAIDLVIVVVLYFGAILLLDKALANEWFGKLVYGLMQGDARSHLTSLIGFVLPWFYFAGLESSSRHGTFGKSLLKIHVLDKQGQGISFWRASVRYMSKTLSSVLLFGFLMVFFTEKKQTLHDKIAGCVLEHRYV